MSCECTGITKSNVRTSARLQSLNMVNLPPGIRILYPSSAAHHIFALEHFMKVLVLGGTRFVGKRLVHLLADQGHEVTVGSRGKTMVSFPSNVRRLKLDRASMDSMAAALQNSQWDIVYDQICFYADDAAS